MNITQPNITLTLDVDGVIQTASLSSRFVDQDVSDWVGSNWADTVGAAASGNVHDMLHDALTSGVSSFREVTQHFPSGLRLPVEYMVVRLGGAAGLIAVGRNLQAVANQQERFIATQHSMEQEHWRARALHPRTVVASHPTREIELLVRAKTLRILEASPTATTALDIAAGSALMPHVPANARDALLATLRAAREQGRAPSMVLHLGKDAAPWVVRASLKAATADAVFLLELEPVNPPAPTRQEAPPLANLVNDLPDAFIVVDEAGVIRHANRTFADLTQVDTGVVGESLGRWMSHPGADARILLAQVQRHGGIRLFHSVITGDLGSDTEVEISAAASAETPSPLVGILIRDVGGRLTPLGSEEDRLRAALSVITDKVGAEPLPSLVRSAVDLVESACIESALKLAKGNRTLAADMLGVSRQALYTKLGRMRGDDGTMAGADASR